MPIQQLEQWFDDTTMSLHIMEWQPIFAKKGKPGAWRMERHETHLNQHDITLLINELIAYCHTDDHAFLEIDRPYSKVLQIGPYRIVIVLPPLSDIRELTIVRPVKKMRLDDYGLDSQLVDRLLHEAQWILIAGAPGEGKTTFAQALVDELVTTQAIIKTIESPRDLVVDDSVIQYSFSHAPHDEVRDILLLSRPDYTVYDEVRNASDFVLYKDLRMTGIGLIGVMHANKPIDSIQRFLWVVDMWIIAQMIDTVLFISWGKVAQVLTLEQVVKTPAWMISEDLARPVIYVKDFLSDEVLYEVYSYGESVVVMPLDQLEEPDSTPTGIAPFAQLFLEDLLRQEFRQRIHVHVDSMHAITLYVPEKIKGKIIGKQGDRIQALEKELGVRISVRSLHEMPS